jgi:hypothetical protein
MADDGVGSGGAFAAKRIVIAGLLILLFGVGPLLLYIAVGPADGNPIGLGLLAVLAVLVGGTLTALGLLKMLIECLVRPSR